MRVNIFGSYSFFVESYIGTITVNICVKQMTVVIALKEKDVVQHVLKYISRGFILLDRMEWTTVMHVPVYGPQRWHCWRMKMNGQRIAPKQWFSWIWTMTVLYRYFVIDLQWIHDINMASVVCRWTDHLNFREFVFMIGITGVAEEETERWIGLNCSDCSGIDGWDPYFRWFE